MHYIFSWNLGAWALVPVSSELPWAGGLQMYLRKNLLCLAANFSWFAIGFVVCFIPK